MPASDEFKKALRSGDLPEAFVMAMGRATELNITTKVVKADGTISETYNPAQQLHTRLDLLNGTIDNEIGEDFVGDSKYRELQQFHQQQVALGNLKIQENFQSLQQLFRLLVTLQQYNRINNAEEPLDLTFLEVPSHALPAERVISSLREQEEAILETVAGVSLPSPTEEVAKPEVFPEPVAAEVEPESEMASPPEIVEPVAPVETVKRVAIAPPIPPLPRRSPPQRDDEPLNFLDSFAALDLDEAPEPEMPLSEVEVDDWETPVESSPAERLAQNTGDAYVPSLDDFDQDDIGDLLGDDDLDDVFEDGDASDSDTESVESVLADADEAAEVDEISVPVVADMEGIDSFDASLFDDDLADEAIESAPELAATDDEIDNSSAVVEEDALDLDALDLDADDLGGLLADDGEEFFDDSDLEASDATTVIEDKELTFDASALEELAEDADVVAETNLDIDPDFDASVVAATDDFEGLAIADDDDDSLDDLLGEEEITEISLGQTSEPTAQADDFLAEEPDAPDLAVPEESIPEAIDSDAGVEPETAPPEEDFIPDDDLLQFLGQDWQSHPDVSEITSLDDELESELDSTNGEPAVLQPLSQEELADLEDVEDTDWFASSLDNEWPPLNTGDTEAPLSGIDFSSDFVDDQGEIGSAGQLESPQDDDFGAVGELDAGLSGEWDALGDTGTEGLGAIEDSVFTPLGLEDEPTLAEATASVDDDFDGLDLPDEPVLEDDSLGELDTPDGELLLDETLPEVPMDDADFDDGSLDMGAIADASLDPLETMDLSTGDIDFDTDVSDEAISPEDGTIGDLEVPEAEGEAIAAVDSEPAMVATGDQPDFSTLPDPFAENLDGWLDQDNEEEVDLGLNSEASMPMEMGEVESPDVTASDEVDALLDPFADWSEDDEPLGDLGGLDLPDLNSVGDDFADGEMSAEMQIDALDSDGDDNVLAAPLADLDDDDLSNLGDLDVGNLGDVPEDFSGDDGSIDGEDDGLYDPFADLEGDAVLGDLGDLDLGNLGDGENDLADGDFSVNAEDEDALNPLADLDGDVLGNLDDISDDFTDSDLSDPFADLEANDGDMGDLGALDSPNLGGIDNDLADDEMSMAEISMDSVGMDNLGDENVAVDPFAELDDVDLGEGDDPLGNLGDLDLTDLDDMSADDPLMDLDDDDLSIGSLGSLEFPDLGDTDGEVDDEGLLSAEVLDSIKELDASTAELNLPNTDGNSALGVMDEIATSGESDLDDADLLSFTDTDDELDLESLALESELELADLDDVNSTAGLGLDGMDSALTFDDDLAIAADGDTDGSWNDLDLDDSADFLLPDLDEDDSNGSIDLDFGLGLTDEAEEPLPAISLETETSGDWQDLELPATDQPASDNAGWDALQTTVGDDSKSTAGDGLDNLAIADLDLEGLNDLGDANLGELGDFDLDSLESDDNTEDFDLFGPDDDADTDSFNLLFESET